MTTPDDPDSRPAAAGSSDLPSTGAASAAGAQGQSPGWERAVLEKLALSSLDEKRRARRWNIFFKILFFAYLAPFLLIFLGWWSPGEHKAGQAGRHTAMVDIKGVIESDGEASAEAINAALRLAFEDVKTAGIVLRLNTPGGSPVQAGIVHDEIKRLRALHPDTPVYAVIEEICASGGYYIAAAADRIYVDKASMVGSIGVLMDGFGFVGVLDMVGVERRLLTAGRNKGFLDRFSPMNDEHRQIGSMHHRPRHAAEQKLLNRPVATGADDDQISAPASRRFQQANCRRLRTGDHLCRLRKSTRQQGAGLVKECGSGAVDDSAGATEQSFFQLGGRKVDSHLVAGWIDQPGNHPHGVERRGRTVHANQNLHCCLHSFETLSLRFRPQ